MLLALPVLVALSLLFLYAFRGMRWAHANTTAENLDKLLAQPDGKAELLKELRSVRRLAALIFLIAAIIMLLGALIIIDMHVSSTPQSPDGKDNIAKCFEQGASLALL